MTKDRTMTVRATRFATRRTAYRSRCRLQPRRARRRDAPIRVETVADGLSLPLGLAWTPDGNKLFFSEVKLGRIRVIVNGMLQTAPFVTLPIARGAETGMLGLAVDPDYARNRFIYAYYSDPTADGTTWCGSRTATASRRPRPRSCRPCGVSAGGRAQRRAARLRTGRYALRFGRQWAEPKIGQDPCKLGGRFCA